MPYSSPATQSSGGVAPATWAASVKAALDWLANAPSCDLTHNTTVSMATGAWTAQNFNTENHDAGGLHDPLTNNDRITVTETGVWLFTAGIAFASNVTGYRGVGFRKNGVGAGPSHAGMIVGAVNGTLTYVIAARAFKLTAADYIQVLGLQNSGGALNSVNQDGMPFCSATLIALG